MNETVTNWHRTSWTSVFRGALAAAIAAALGALLALPGCGDLAKSNCLGICEDGKSESCGAKIPSGTDCNDYCQAKLDEAEEIGCLDAYQDVLLQCETDSCGAFAASCEEAGEFIGCFFQGCSENPDAAACKAGQ